MFHLKNESVSQVDENYLFPIFDLNKCKHNLNHKTRQITLDGLVMQNYCYYFFGIVSSEVINITNDVWFSKLNSKQITKMEDSFKLVGSEKWWKPTKK